jgi:hypothetical protein
MTDADMTRPAADDNPKDPQVPAVEPAPPGEPAQAEDPTQADDDAAGVEQTGGQVANPYVE